MLIGIGVMAVQLAKYYGAAVTAVDSGEKLAMLRAIGADHVVDYQQENFRALRPDLRRDLRRGRQEPVLGQPALAQARRALSARQPRPGGADTSAVEFVAKRQAVVIGAASHKTEELVFLPTMRIDTPLRSGRFRCYPQISI